jgi:hypothetical protein
LSLLCVALFELFCRTHNHAGSFILGCTCLFWVTNPIFRPIPAVLSNANWTANRSSNLHVALHIFLPYLQRTQPMSSNSNSETSPSRRRIVISYRVYSFYVSHHPSIHPSRLRCVANKSTYTPFSCICIHIEPSTHSFGSRLHVSSSVYSRHLPAEYRTAML